jgi:hypothetical protein
MPDQIIPPQGASDEMKGDQDNAQDEEGDVDTLEIADNLRPIYAPEEKEEENDCQEGDEAESDPVLIH